MVSPHNHNHHYNQPLAPNHPPPQKPSAILTSTLLLLATPAPSLTSPTQSLPGWECNGGPGPGEAGLRQIHGDFNRLFGRPRLNMAAGQCYIAVCRGLVFGVCNRAGYGDSEVSGDRDRVVNDVGAPWGSPCSIVLSPAHRPYLGYLFSRERDITLNGPKNDIRRC